MRCSRLTHLQGTRLSTNVQNMRRVGNIVDPVPDVWGDNELNEGGIGRESLTMCRRCLRCVAGDPERYRNHRCALPLHGGSEKCLSCALKRKACVTPEPEVKGAAGDFETALEGVRAAVTADPAVVSVERCLGAAWANCWHR